MPELPDVEGFANVLVRHALDHRINDVTVLDSQVLRGSSARRLREVLRGNRLGKPERHGKWLVVPVDGARGRPHLLMHFGMTGALTWADEGAERHRHDRVIFGVSGGEIRYRDMRKLKGLYLARDTAEVDTLLADLGPDALSVSRDQLAELLCRTSRQLKPAMADQAALAGLGNLLVDEILWRARIHPRRRTSDLSRAELTRLHGRMGAVLRQSVKAERVPPRRSWLTGRRDEPAGSCPRCATTLSHGRVGGRGTTWCPRCQPE